MLMWDIVSYRTLPQHCESFIAEPPDRQQRAEICPEVAEAI
jgi:hypothetical protein